MEDQYIIPPLQLTITTYELIGDKWIASVSHTFHASDQNTLFALIEAHKTTDQYFKASFDGIFYYHGGIICLRNSDATTQYP